MIRRRALQLAPTPPADARQALGLLVPWDVATLVTDDGVNYYREAHARGSLLVSPSATVPVFAGHTPTGERGPQIADVVELTDRPDGLYGRLVMRAGHNSPAPGEGLSIEFEELETVTDAAGVAVRVRSQLLGLAITPTPQYPTARIHQSRAGVSPVYFDQFGNPVTLPTTTPPAPAAPPAAEHNRADPAPTPPPSPAPSTTPADDSHRRAAAAQSLAPQPMTPAVTVRPSRFRSMGEFMAAVANRAVDETDRDNYFRALSTATTADDARHQEQWVTEIVDYVGQLRPFVTAFSSMPLPASGMTIAYPRVGTRPQTAKQAAQLDEVATGKAVITKATAGVETYAGGTRISLQEIQRSDPSYLQLLFELYSEEMAIDMDQAAIAAVAAVVPAGNKITISAAANVNLLNGKLVAGVKTMLASKAPYDPVFVIGLDLWERFANAVDGDGRPLFPHAAAMNPVGSIDLTSPTTGEVRSLRYVVDANMTATKGYLGWRRAYTSMLGGLQTLSADAVANLGRDEVVFQFGAHLVRRPDAIVEYTLGA